MKLPNGYGSVRKLSGKRRNPWHVQKTVSYFVDVENKKVIQKRVTIGFYATQKEALQALAEYNANPYDIDAAKITFEEVFEKWSEQKYKEVSRSNINGYNAAFRLCESIYKYKMVDVKLEHLQAIVDNSGKNTPTLRKLKVLLRQMFDYAVVHEIIDKSRNMVEYVNIKAAGNPNAYNRKPFSMDEVDVLWKHKDNEYVMVVLILIYTGVRISELLDLKKEDINIEEQYFDVVKSKTAAGIRTVPIADKIKPFFEYWFNKNDSEYLLSTPEGEHFLYRNYYDSYFMPYMKELDLPHKPHDARHTCISMLAEAKVEPTTIKKIVGHAGTQSITERVYTHLDVKVLLEAVNKL